MVLKWKNLAFDIFIILIISTIISFSINEFRNAKIPLLPPYLNKSQYNEMNLITFQQNGLKNSHCFIFDARPHELHQNDHIAGSLNFPASQFDFFYHFYLKNTSHDVPIFIYGRTISHAFDKELAYRLSLIGYKNVTVIQK